MSHQARAYLHNAGALKGFLKEDHVLKTILSEGGFDAVLKYQSSITLRQDLRLKNNLTIGLKLKFLMQSYPSLAVMVLKKMGRHSDAEKFIQKCKEYEHDYQNYTYYIFGYLIPWLD